MDNLVIKTIYVIKEVAAANGVIVDKVLNIKKMYK